MVVQIKEKRPKLDRKLCALCSLNLFLFLCSCLVPKNFSFVKYVFATINYLKNKELRTKYTINCTTLCILNLNCKFVWRRLFIVFAIYLAFFVCSLSRVLYNYSFCTNQTEMGVYGYSEQNQVLFISCQVWTVMDARLWLSVMIMRCLECKILTTLCKNIFLWFGNGIWYLS